MTGLKADRAEVQRFVASLFRYADDGTFASLRAFDQLDANQPAALLQPVRINGDLSKLADAAAGSIDRLLAIERPVVFAPPICTFTNADRARVADLANGLTLSVEIDDGDTRIARQKLERLLGRATIIVESGGEWVEPVTGEIFPKIHLHWRLSEPTREADDHAKLRQARDLAARLVGADPTGKPVVHPLRWPGSWNRKGKPRLARIVAFNDAAEINLEEALEAVSDAIEVAGMASVDMPVSGPPEAAQGLVASAMAAIPNGGTDVHYDDWIRLGYAVHRATGGTGYGIWDDWSQKSVKYNATETETTWRRIGRAIVGSTARQTVGAGTIFFEAKATGWRRPVPAKEPPPDINDQGYIDATERAAKEHNAVRSKPKQVSGPGADQAVEWAEPVDFLSDDEATGAPELRRSHLPGAIAPFVFDTASRMGVDPAGVALAAIVSLASVMTDDWCIQPKQFDTTWTENPRLWGAIVGDPSILKTPVVRAATAPIDKLEVEARERYEVDMGRFRRQMKAWKDAGSDSDSEPKEPRLGRFLVEGTTTEALTEALRDDPKAKQTASAGKVLIRQDEMSEWLAGFDRYRSGGNGGADRGAYLRLYNGGRYTLDRVNRGTFSIPNWSACILGGIQPGPIQKIARDAADDGLLQRFVYCVPGHQRRGEDRKPDTEAIDRYKALFPVLAALTPPRSHSGGFSRIVLHADAHAQRAAILDLAEAVAAMPDTSDRLKAALGKWPGLWARLTLTFHLIDVADARTRGDAGDVVNVVRGAATTATQYMRDILLPHLLRAESIMFSTAQTGHARWIAGHILGKPMTRIAIRDLVQAYRALRAPEQRRELIEIMNSLEAMAWVQAEPQVDGRPPVAWGVNPLVYSRFAEQAAREKADRHATKIRIRETLARHIAPNGR